MEGERAKAALAIENIARNFKALNIPIADIAKATGMSIEEIERL